jgi:hypothetical protein
MGHLAVEKSGAGNGADLDFIANPFSAGQGNVALTETRSKGEAIVVQDVGGTVFVLRIYGLDKRSFAKKKTYLPEVIELGLQFIVGKDSKIGGDDIQVGAGYKLRAEEVSDSATLEGVIANAGAT